MTHDKDADLLLAKQGDKDALGRLLMVHYKGLIAGLCRQFCPPEMDYEDAIQTAYFPAVEAVKYYQLDRGIKFTTYLTQCVVRKLNQVRKRSKYRTHYQEPETNVLDTNPSKQHSDGQDLLAGLDQTKAWIVSLRMEQVPFRTIAKKLGLTENMAILLFDEAAEFLVKSGRIEYPMSA